MNMRRLISKAICLLTIVSGTNANAQLITTVAGTGVAGNSVAGGLAYQSMVSSPYGVVADGNGNIFYTDFANNKIRKISPCGILSDIAGTGVAGHTGDGGQATAAKISGPTGITMDGSGNIYFCDYNNKRVRKIAATTGIISNFAGTGAFGNNGDGAQATAATFDAPAGIIADASGNIYFDDIAHNRIRKISTSGIISHYAGDQTGTSGTTGDGGAATAAFLNQPQGLAVDAIGNIYIADAGNNKVRMVSATTGIITNVAGNGTAGFSGDGSAATAAMLNNPTGVYVDASNNIYVADFGNNNVRIITGGNIGTYAGTNSAGFSGDQGSATAAMLNGPFGIAGSSSGALYVTDSMNERIRNIFVDAGPRFINNSSSFAICENSGAFSINTLLYGKDTIVNQVLNWTNSTNPKHGTLVTGASVTSTGCGSLIPSGMTYRPTTGYSGNDTFVVKITDGLLSDSATIVVTVNPLPATGVITGAYSLCIPASVTFSENVSGGTWALTNNHASYSPVASTDYVVITSNTNGIDTLSYTLISGAGCVASTSKIFVINPYASVITGLPSSSICTGNTALLADSVAGGVWSSSNNSVASIQTNGLLVPVAAGVDTIVYSLTACGAFVTATKTITINATPDPGTISGSSTICLSTSTSFTDAAAGGSWTLSNTNATVDVSGNVTANIAGIDTLFYTVSTAFCSATDTDIILVAPFAGKITAPGTLCLGTSYTLTETVSGGTWSSSNPDTVSIDPSTGIATIVNTGTVTISYSVSSSCPGSPVIATKTMNVHNTPTAPAQIIGPDTVCVNSTISLSDVTLGGIWTRSPSPGAGGTVVKIAATDSAVFTGLSGGNVIISYSMSGSGSTAGCSSDTTKTVFVKSKPTVPGITGSVNTCIGYNMTTLADATTGGYWTSNDVSFATVDSMAGVVTGVAAGVVTISYSDSNNCGTTTVSKIVTVNPSPDAGFISGSTSVCQNATTTLTETISGGTWLKTNNNASVTAGLVTGLTGGIDTIMYRVHSTYCGDDTTRAFMTINPLPKKGTITGSSAVCTGVNDTLLNNTFSANAVVWESLNPSIATVISSGDSNGIVTGIAAGIDTIRFIVSNTCGSDSTQKIITVHQSPHAGVIYGSNQVCVSAKDTLRDTTANLTGGSWIRTNTFASVAYYDSVTGVVTGLSAGTDTIMFKLPTSSCGTDYAVAVITVKALPDAGTITGSSTVCAGASITVSDVTASGGTTRWYSKHPATAFIPASAGSTIGVLSGIAAGSDSVLFVLTSTSCGNDTAYKSVTVIAQPFVSSIDGVTRLVCVGDTITLTDPTTGNKWSASNNNAKVVDTATMSGVANGFIKGQVAGFDTIQYSQTNICGTYTDTFIVQVLPLANSGIITGSSNLCQADTLTYRDTISGGAWYSIDTVATITIGGKVKALKPGVDSILYVVTNSCNSDTSWKKITISPLPVAGTITGLSQLCRGGVITLTDTLAGGTWSHVNGNTNVNSQGIVIGNAVGKDTIRYRITNGCGSDTAKKVITVNAMPEMPNMVTHSPSKLCLGTMYQNFGVDTAAYTGENYAWSVVNGDLYATGKGHQYCLVNFTDTGISIVKAIVTVNATGCKDSLTYSVAVSTTNTSPTTQVIYSSPEFFCLDNTASSYQWGYDDAVTKDSVSLPGEINQNCYVPSPNFTNKYYWVISKYQSCYQKTYYNAPTGITPVAENNLLSLEIFPNPANEVLNIRTTGLNLNETNILIITDLAGKVIMTTPIKTETSELNIGNLPTGFYLAVLVHNGERLTTKPLIKN